VVLNLLRRRAGPRAAPPANRAEEILDRLIDQDELIDRFDASYLDDLPDILREVHHATEENVREHPLWPDLRELWRLAGRADEEFAITELPDVAITELGVNIGRYSPAEATPRVKRKYRYTTVQHWERAAGLRLGRDSRGVVGDRALVNTVQREYSLQQGGQQEVEFHDLGRPETGDPWTSLIIELRERGVFLSDEPVLTLGPRWVGEITYFREKLGLRGAIGLDLFSPDDERIKAGDMHDMPFETDMFGLIYQRNTFDKSYDIRAALRECLRVLRDGGVLITDDCYAYTEGVSELSRTSIKHNHQILRVLEPHVGKVLHDRETPAGDDWIERVGQLALTVRK
jgi:SAM-dependent methyltransferase